MDDTSKRIHLIYDGLNILIPSLSVNPLYNSKYINVFPVMYFLRRIYKDIFNLKLMEQDKQVLFEKMVKDNLYKFLTPENISIHVVFDIGKDMARGQLSKDYKSNRKQYKTYRYGMFNDSEEFHKAVIFYRNLFNKLFQVMGYNVYMFPFVEGDCIIGYITQELKKDENNFIYIVSNDSDFYELLDKNVNIINHRKSKEELYIINDSMEDRKNVFLKMGLIKDITYNFYPSLRIMPYIKCLTGESVDGIKRIKSIKKFHIREIINKMIKEKKEYFKDFDDFWNTCKNILNDNRLYTMLYENFMLISLEYYSKELLSPHDMVVIKNTINKKNMFNIDKFLEIMEFLELTESNFSWLC